MIKWSVLIDGIGLRVVMSKDIDGAYLAAMKEYGCKIEDILAVFCHSPYQYKFNEDENGNENAADAVNSILVEQVLHVEHDLIGVVLLTPKRRLTELIVFGIEIRRVSQ